jgi:hypothetical protein
MKWNQIQIHDFFYKGTYWNETRYKSMNIFFIKAPTSCMKMSKVNGGLFHLKPHTGNRTKGSTQSCGHIIQLSRVTTMWQNRASFGRCRLDLYPRRYHRSNRSNLCLLPQTLSLSRPSSDFNRPVHYWLRWYCQRFTQRFGNVLVARVIER